VLDRTRGVTSRRAAIRRPARGATDWKLPFCGCPEGRQGGAGGRRAADRAALARRL